MKKINEIFYSLQGEGHFTGTAAVFIRFSGCNLSCDFCDTSHQDGEWMSITDVLEAINPYPAKHIVLTGGEPALYLTAEWISLLKAKGYYLQIETNGTRELPAGIDWVTCSPKPTGKTIIKHPDELKVVYTGQDMSVYEDFTAGCYYLQPCSGQNIPETVAYIKAHPKWRLSLQTHKLIDIR